MKCQAQLLVVTACLIFGRSVAVAAPSASSDHAACIARKVDFSGVTPLTYANAIGESGSKVYIRSQLDEECAHSSTESCSKGPYIVPGDAVAIGKTCSDWDYVQYLGEAHPTEGWVLAKQLAPLTTRPTTPPELVPPLSWEAQGIPPPQAKRYVFRLTQGHGKAVCEAYLQRLNQTAFYAEPYCGRPESATVPGFVVLHRQWLSRSRYVALVPYVFALLSNRSLSEEIPPAETPADFRPTSWTYDPPVDIENDGAPDHVLMWSDDERGYSHCGGGGVTGRGDISAVLLTPTGKVDAARTLAIFGRPGIVPGIPNRTELGHEFGVFKYRRLTYFDTFGNPDTAEPSNQLAVYLYSHGGREEICDYTAALGDR
jgi:hypothetical protein